MKVSFCVYTCILIAILPSTAGISWALIKNSCLNIIMSVKTHWNSIFKKGVTNTRTNRDIQIYTCRYSKPVVIKNTF